MYMYYKCIIMLTFTNTWIVWCSIPTTATVLRTLKSPAIFCSIGCHCLLPVHIRMTLHYILSSYLSFNPPVWSYRRIWISCSEENNLYNFVFSGCMHEHFDDCFIIAANLLYIECTCLGVHAFLVGGIFCGRLPTTHFQWCIAYFWAWCSKRNMPLTAHSN